MKRVIVSAGSNVWQELVRPVPDEVTILAKKGTQMRPSGLGRTFERVVHNADFASKLLHWPFTTATLFCRNAGMRGSSWYICDIQQQSDM